MKTAFTRRAIARSLIAAGFSSYALSWLFRRDFEAWYVGALEDGSKGRRAYAWGMGIVAAMSILSRDENANRAFLALLSAGLASRLVREPAGSKVPNDSLGALNAFVWITLMVSAWLWYSASQYEDGESAAWMFGLSMLPVMTFGIPCYAIWVVRALKRDAAWKWGIVAALLMLPATAIALGHTFPYFM